MDRSENIANRDEEVNDKIQKTFKLLALRDPYSLVQFWSRSNSGAYNLLKVVDPFGLGIHNPGLLNYRSESKRHCFHVDEECKEEDLIPIVRVFRRRLPEWTCDLKNYRLKKHPLQDCAIRWNLQGYLVLPVFDSITMLCVGVLELITSSKHLDYHYEVQEVHRTLKEANLTSPQAFDCPFSVNYKNIQHELDDIFNFLKDVCDTHKLPLAQTWTVSSRSSCYVATERNMERACNSFNTRCIGKVCMSTTGLPFYVKDLRFWHFREACRKHHLLKSKGVVGRALSSHGSCLCFDVAKLGEDEYSLVHNARMSGLTSCYAVYLHSNEHDEGYILEFFLPINMKEDKDLQNLLQKMKMHFKSTSFEFGDLLSMDMIGMPMEASLLSSTMQLDTINKSSSKQKMQLDLQRVLMDTCTHIDCLNAQNQSDFGQVSHMNSSITSSEEMYVDDGITSKNIDIVTVGKKCKSGEKPSSMKKWGKHKTDSLASEHVRNYSKILVGEATMSLESLSREILQQDSRETQTSQQTNDQDQHVCSEVSIANPKFVCKSNPSVHIRETICGSYAHSGVYQSCPKKNKVSNVLDKRMVTVKATFKDDMIKFIFPLSSGLSELKKQVAQRFKLEATRICLNYKDEDDDLILISCDADFHNLMPFSASPVGKNTIKLIVQMADTIGKRCNSGDTLSGDTVNSGDNRRNQTIPIEATLIAAKVAR
ncbi:hypothetical protein E3N88_30929 [Mikania micrantha]|uniref:PB1 domain-containing protein n=1 Tax=Mikania micrantha TaxID=192012 RepID=A0A5N6MMZ8_9ASTR|nr:hypothetical protein E3N88_30929 [Mikania micrantha]